MVSRGYVMSGSYSMYSDSQRASLEKHFQERMERAKSIEWATLWRAELLFVQGDEERGVELLEKLGRSEDVEVAMFAHLHLGNFFATLENLETALREYRAAERLCTSADERSNALLHQAEVMRKMNRVEDAVEVLKPLTQNLGSVSERHAQTLMIEYGSLLLDQGMNLEAEHFFVSVQRHFNSRSDLLDIAIYLREEYRPRS